MFRKHLLALLCAMLGVPTAASAAIVDRSEYTTTRQLPDGKLSTAVSPQPLNFQTESGAWKPVDLALEAAGNGVLSPAAVDGDIVIPDGLSSPIVVEHDGREASIRLKGASGDAEVDDATAVFDDALPGVDVQYEATARGVKERLVLASAEAPVVFAYDVRAGEAWSAAVDSLNQVVLRDGAGVERYRLTAPLAWDSAEDPSFTNDLRLAVSKVSDGRWTVTLRPDLAWLRDSARVFPVTLDPDFSWSNGTTTFNGATDTYLASGDKANSVFSASSYLQTGHFNRTYRTLVRFNVAAAIPSNAVVSGSTFKAYAPPATPKSLASHSLRTVTAEWDANANWNRRKVGVPWTTLGGEVSSNSAYTSASTNVQTNPGWYSWTAPVATVQGWVAGTLPNYGFQLTTDAGAPSGNAYVWASTEASMSSDFPADATKRPILEVTWSVPDTTAPALSLSGELSSNQSTWRTANTGDITLSATDAGTGVKRLEILEGSTVLQSQTQACASGGCSQNHTFSLDLDALGEGVHTLKAAAVDGGNLRTEQTFTVRVDRAAPGLALTGTLVDDESEPAQSGSRSVHVVATDAGAGIVDLELKVDGVQREHVTQTCAAGGCSRTEDWSVDIGALAEGTHAVEITASDSAGTTKTRNLTIHRTDGQVPTLDVSGAFVQAATQGALPPDSRLKARFAAHASSGAVTSVAAWAGDVLLDKVDDSQCASPCTDLAGELDMSVASVLPGAREAKFVATDSNGRSALEIVAFERQAEPSLASLVTEWTPSYKAAVDAQGASDPSAPFPAPTAAVLGEGSCQATPTSSSCLRGAASWASQVQQWLESADLDATSTEVLPAFPYPEGPAHDGAPQDAAEAIQGMLRLAENVARRPGTEQPVGVTFDQALSKSEVQTWAAGRTALSHAAVGGSPGPGGWAAQLESDEPTDVPAVLEDYLAHETQSTADTISEIEGELNRAPGDATLTQALEDAQNYQDGLQGGDVRFEGLSTSLTASASATALEDAATGALNATIAGPATPDERGTIELQPPGARQPSAQRAAQPVFNCDVAGMNGLLPVNRVHNVNPRYWAPDWFKGDSKLWPKHWPKQVANDELTGDKLHLLRAQWNSLLGLAWVCADKSKKRSVELEARVTRRLNDDDMEKKRARWSTNWPRNGRYVHSNLPGGPKNWEHDDLARGPNGELIPQRLWYQSDDYPDFAIVMKDARQLEYFKRYFVDFRTNDGKTKKDQQAGVVTYSAQANSKPTDWKETTYCGQRVVAHYIVRRLAKVGRHAACYFARSTVCFGQEPIVKPPVEFGSRTSGGSKWEQYISSSETFLDNDIAYPEYTEEQATSPCVAKPTLKTRPILSFKQYEAGFPEPTREPQLIGCREADQDCSVDPGSWPQGVSLSFGADFCNVTDPCVGVESTPRIKWRSEEIGGCVRKSAVITVIATDTAGRTAWKPLEGPEVIESCLGAPTDTCNGASTASPRGDQMLLSYDPPTGLENWIYGSNGSDGVRFGEIGSGQGRSSWSPDRRRIITLESDQLVARYPGSQDEVILVAGGIDGAFHTVPQCSPDGREVAFTTKQGTLDVVNLADGSIRTVADNASGGAPPAWSPDGRRLAFTRAYGFDFRADTVVVDADGTSERVLGDGIADEYGPRWAPDSKHLFALRNPMDTTEGYYPILRNADVESDCHRLRAPFLDRWQWWGSFEVSPSGGNLAYAVTSIVLEESRVEVLDIYTGTWRRMLPSSWSSGAYGVNSWGGTLRSNPGWQPPTGLATC